MALRLDPKEFCTLMREIELDRPVTNLRNLFPDNIMFERLQAFDFHTSDLKPLVMLWPLAFMHSSYVHVRSWRCRAVHR